MLLRDVSHVGQGWGSWGGTSSTTGRGLPPAGPPHPSHSCVQAGRCCFARPNSTCTFCFGLLNSAWHLGHTSLTLLTEWSGAGHSPGLCFKMFAALLTSAVWLFWLGQEPPATRVPSSLRVIADWGLNYPCHLLGKLHSLSHTKASYCEATFPEPM